MSSGIRGIKTVDDLPTEILVEIFSYLNVEDIVYNVRHVNQRWSEVVQDSTLWHFLTYRPVHPYDHQVINVFKHCPKLRWFKPEFYYVTSKQLEVIPMYCKDIRELGIYLDDESEDILKKMVTECPYIENLTIHFYPYNAHTSKLLQIISKCERLKRLRITGDASGVDGVFRVFANSCPSLHSINILGLINYSEKDLVNLLIKRKDSITCLYLTCCDTGSCVLPAISESGVFLENLHASRHTITIDDELVQEFCKKCQNMKKLSFPYCRSRNLPYLARYMQSTPLHRLTELNLEWCKYTELILSPEMFRSCCNLQKLSLGMTSIRDGSLMGISILKKLEYLDITNCHAVTDDGVSYISKCSNLRFLDIVGCTKLTHKSFSLCCDNLKLLRELHLSISAIDAKSMLEIPKKLKYLRVLEIGHIQESIIPTLKQNMPNLCVRELDRVCYASVSFRHCLNRWLSS